MGLLPRAPRLDRDALPHDSVKGAQALQPLFEFSGACAGCGETPYIKLVTQLFGDRMIVANATGCSSIYGGNLPTTPWTTNTDGRGPAWNNSLFEDNAEFGLGLRLGYEAQQHQARLLVERLAVTIGPDLATAILDADQSTEAGIRTPARARGPPDERSSASVGDRSVDDAARGRHLASVAGALVTKSTWIIGGDGWAYDIGFGGLDHVLSSGRDVNILVLDTEVYSNTGGQASKSTPRGAVAKFAGAGKPTGKKDLGAIARAYGNVYVAQIAMGANDTQTTKAFVEAAAWPGPSLVIAYSTCIAHGIDMSTSMTHQKDAVRSGYWPLYRYSPSDANTAHPSTSIRQHRRSPLRSSSPPRPATRSSGARIRTGQRSWGTMLQADADERWRYYSQLAAVERTVADTSVHDGVHARNRRGPGGTDGAGTSADASIR